MGMCAQWIGILALGAAAVAAAPALAQVNESREHRFEVEVLADGLQNPWALAFLSDGRILVTERPGRLRVFVPGQGLSAPVAGLPEVFARGQGGLLDLALHPDHADNGWIYFSYAAPGDRGAFTAVSRARLDGAALRDVETVFEARNPGSGGRHFGSRIAFGPDGKLYVSFGERGDADAAQDPSNHNGTVVRLNDDGSVPGDNPQAGRTEVLPSIFSYGHRNPQGMARHPTRDEIWVHEHGPQGGDEINRLVGGANYGWPVVTFGRSYAGFPIGEGSSKAGMEPPLHHWTPSIAPSGMTFYDGDAFPRWRGNLFVGSLKFRYLARLTLDGTRVVAEERLIAGQHGRIRDVRQGPDGLIYLLSDESDGQLLRLRPATE
jgi:glucose/arabinose dehydrogenase